MKATMSYYFLSQRYEREYVKFKNVENGIKRAPIKTIHAKRLSNDLDKHLGLTCSTPHFTAVIFARTEKINESELQ